jgi:flagellar basal-body rod modification protein FlgD
MDISQMYSSVQHANAAATGSTVASHGAASAGTTARAAATTGSSTSTKNADITSNDFLTLLVTEMKNQDPTATTDPNAYINQLVGVNSLQQLIQINTDLGGNSTTTSTTGKVSSAVANALSKDSTASQPEAVAGNHWTPKAANASDWEAAVAKSGAASVPLSF